MMNKQGKTILLVEQNARAGLRLSTHGVVLENGRVRLAGSGHEVLHHPEIGALYLGGAVTDSSGTASPAAEGVDAAAARIAAADAAAMSAGSGGTDPAANGTAANGTAAR
jgi:ABC-type sulfate/molybdate transport systems ATPase subunit